MWSNRPKCNKIGQNLPSCLPDVHQRHIIGLNLCCTYGSMYDANLQRLLSTGFHPCQTFMNFRNPEETALLWMHVMYSPNQCKKITRAEKLLNTRALIVILLSIGGIESHPVS